LLCLPVFLIFVLIWHSNKDMICHILRYLE